MNDDRSDFYADGAGYVDAATIALRFASVELGPTPLRLDLPVDLPEVTPRLLRDTMGCLVTGVCVITSTTGGEDVAMTANSVTSVSLDPPLILVCVARSARFHDAIVEAPGWGVSVLDADAVAISTTFANSGRSRTGQFDELNHHRGAATGVALLDSSCATLECLTEAIHPGGDHSIVVGRVVAAQLRADSVHPLLYHRGSYSWLQT